jgi:hypothetical protein
MADNNLLYAQDYSIDSCKVVTSLGQPYELKFVLLYLTYFEDLYSNFITGQLTINDSVGLLSQLAFNGHDYLIFSFSKPGYEYKVEKTFRIFKVSDRELVNNQNETFKLHFCSEEAILSEQYKVSKSYKNTKVSDIVKDIAYNYLKIDPTKFPVTNIEDTQGVRDIIIPNLKPFEAINWLCTQGISANTTSPAYFFYENVNGYNFRTLDYMYTTPVYGVYKYEPKNLNIPDDTRVQDLSLEANNVIDYQFVNNFDSLNSINSGAFANQLITIDPLRNTFNQTNFDYMQFSSRAKMLNQYPVLANNQNRFSQTTNQTSQAVLKVATTTTGDARSPYIYTKKQDIKDLNIEFTVPYRTAELALINSVKYKITVPGDPLLTPGTVITFNLPELTRTTDGKDVDQYYSGNYLITAVKHLIDVENRFMSLLEISKESLPNKYVDPDNSQQAWSLIRSR